MDIAWFRDLVISVFGIATIVVLIFIAVLIFMLYHRIMPIINSIKTTTKTVENISTCIEAEVAGPISQMAAFVQGVRQAVSMIGSLRKRKGECKDE